MKIINFIIIFSILSILFLPDNIRAAEQIDINAKGALLADIESGEIFYSKNIHDRLYPASTTKIMTALLVLEACERGEVSLSDTVTASDTFQEGLIWDGSTQNIQPGEKMTLEDLLYCIMLASANEACNIAAEYVTGGSVSEFVGLMNKRAGELGCTDTVFTNTNGIPDENHYTTVYDIYLITREAMKHPKFVSISNTAYKEIPATNISDTRQITTTNSLILPGNEKYYYKYAKGIKTGSTNDAGFCLVSSAERNGMTLVSVILGAQAVPQEDESYLIESFTETKKLFEWFYNNYSSKVILSKIELIKQVAVELGDGADSVVVRPNEDLTLILPNKISPEDFTRNITIYSEQENAPPLQAPVDEGQVLGEISLTYMDKTYGPFQLVANTEVSLSKIAFIKARISHTLSQPLARIIIVAVFLVIALYIIFVVRYNIIRRKRRKAMKSSPRLQTLPIDKELDIRSDRR